MKARPSVRPPDGIPGAIELIVGLALPFVPALLHTALEATADRASAGDSALSQFIGSYLENLDNSLTKSGLTVVILFLTLHGAIKLALVYCLLRKLHRAYPIALVMLGLFPVYREYKELRNEAVAAALGSMRTTRPAK